VRRRTERLEDRAQERFDGYARRLIGRSERRTASATIRIATFQLGRLDEAKLANSRVREVLVRLFSNFDLIAVQGVRGKIRAS